MKKNIHSFLLVSICVFWGCNEQLLDSTVELGKNKVKKTAIDPGKYNEDLNQFAFAVSMAIRDNYEFSELLVKRFIDFGDVKKILVSQLISEESEYGPYIADILMLIWAIRYKSWLTNIRISGYG